MLVEIYGRIPMLFLNFNLILPQGIQAGSLRCDQGKITELGDLSPRSGEEVIHGHGDLYLCPGFLDVHVHGAGGADVMDGKAESLRTISKTLAKTGTTGFLATTMTQTPQAIRKALAAISQVQDLPGAQILGVHLEGPFINPAAAGAQDPDLVLAPSLAAYENLVAGYENLIRTVTLAPELAGAQDLIRALAKKGINASLGHTQASYDQALAGIRAGANHATHLFNAMTGLHHRQPGTVGAVFDTDITTEAICDEVHVHPAVLRLIYQTKGVDKLLLVTDAMMGCGMPDGDYELGGQPVKLVQGEARLLSGALAGSVLTMIKAIQNVARHSELPLYEIINMASLNPAKLAGYSDRKGQLAPGFDGDLVILTADLTIDQVYLAGRPLL